MLQPFFSDRNPQSGYLSWTSKEWLFVQQCATAMPSSFLRIGCCRLNWYRSSNLLFFIEIVVYNFFIGLEMQVWIWIYPVDNERLEEKKFKIRYNWIVAPLLVMSCVYANLYCCLITYSRQNFREKIYVAILSFY